MAKAKATKEKKVQKTRGSSKRNPVTKTIKKLSSQKNSATNRALIENFIGLQKVMVTLSTKFDNLSSQISKLLELFEVSARSLAKKDLDSNSDNKETKLILEKLDKLSEHAGLIGKGLVLLHELGSEKNRSDFQLNNNTYEKSIHAPDIEKSESSKTKEISPSRKSTMKPSSALAEKMPQVSNLKSQTQVKPPSQPKSGVPAKSNATAPKTREIQ